MKVKSESEVALSCPTLRDPTDCSLPGSSVHEIFQATVLEWIAIAFSNKMQLIKDKSKEISHIEKTDEHLFNQLKYTTKQKHLWRIIIPGENINVKP